MRRSKSSPTGSSTASSSSSTAAAGRAQLVSQFRVFALQQLVSTQQIDAAVFCRRHEPCARIPRHTGFRPLLQRRYQRILREFLGPPHVADQAGESGDEPCRFDPPNRLDRAMGVGSGHCYRSHHRQPLFRNRRGQRLACLSISSRRACSLAASSGVRTSAGKSAASNTCRISSSVSFPSPCGAGQRFAHSMASSFDFT